MTRIEYFERLYTPEPNSGCWLWIGFTHKGYGKFAIGGGRAAAAHRYAYEHFVGPIPAGKMLDHLCRNRGCVNPDHLRVCTNRENVLAPGSLAVTKANSEKTHCPRGHRYDEANTRYFRGWRYCRPCSSEWSRKHRGVKETATGGVL